MANKVLVLDAGHSLVTAGKRTMNGSRGVIHEWTMNDSVCRKVAAILKDYNVDIYRTDDTSGKTDISLSERTRRCNNYNPDLFISIHHNAGGGTGTEVYFHTRGTAEDKKVATLLAPILASKCGMRNRGVKYKELGVLNCRPTAILVEGGFMDTVSDYEIITSDNGQQKYAEAVAEMVIGYLGLKRVVTTKPFAIGDYDAYVETTDDLNIRAKRNASSERKGTIPKGKRVKVDYILGVNDTHEQPLWGSVYSEYGNGFINLNYTKPVA